MLTVVSTISIITIQIAISLFRVTVQDRRDTILTSLIDLRYDSSIIFPMERRKLLCSLPVNYFSRLLPN